MILLSGHFDLQALEASIEKTNYIIMFAFENNLGQYKVDTVFINNSVLNYFSYKSSFDKFIGHIWVTLHHTWVTLHHTWVTLRYF